MSNESVFISSIVSRPRENDVAIENLRRALSATSDFNEATLLLTKLVRLAPESVKTR